MTWRTEYAMWRPNHDLKASPRLQALRVRLGPLLHLGLTCLPLARLDLFSRDRCERYWLVSLGIFPEGTCVDMHRVMRVQCHDDPFNVITKRFDERDDVLRILRGPRYRQRSPF